MYNREKIIATMQEIYDDMEARANEILASGAENAQVTKTISQSSKSYNEYAVGKDIGEGDPEDTFSWK